MSLIRLHTAHVRDAADDSDLGGFIFYDDNYGLLAYVSGVWSGNLDGKMFSRGGDIPHVLDCATVGNYLTKPDNLVDDYYRVDKQSLVRYGPAITSPPNPNGFHVMCSDRWLDIRLPNIYYAFLDDVSYANPGSLEYTFPGLALVDYGAVHFCCFTRSQNIIHIISRAGVIMSYDYVLKTEVNERRYLPVPNLMVEWDRYNGIYYSAKHDIYVAGMYAASAPAVYEENQVSVFSTEVYPVTLTNPEIVPDVLDVIHWGPGIAVPLRVQLLGDRGEAVPDMLVDWSLTAGVGSLLYPQSTTDEEGYAYNRHLGPIGGTGDITVNVEVRF